MTPHRGGVIAPEPLELEDLRRTLTGVPGGLRDAFAVKLAQRLRHLDPPTGYVRHPLTGFPGGNLHPLTHALGTLTGVPGGSHPPLMLGPGTLTGILPGNHPPLTLSRGTARKGHLKVAHENLHFL